MGVARQWCGRLGKVDNCQVGVFAALGRGHLAALTDLRLFVPEEWAGNERRCKAAGIPAEHHQAKSKTALALEMVRHQRALGVRFAWVGVDGGYGKEPEFLRAVEDLGETFVADVHKNQRIYLCDPEPRVPQGRRGRPPSRLRAHREGHLRASSKSIGEIYQRGRPKSIRACRRSHVIYLMSHKENTCHPIYCPPITVKAD